MAPFGILQILVIKTLSKKDLNGNQIIKAIKEKTGKKFSCGSLYPLLSRLISLGLISVDIKKNEHIYSLTSRGKKLIKDSSEKQEEIFNKIKELVNLLKILGEEDKTIEQIKKNMNSKHLEYFLMQEQLFEFKKDLLSVDFKKHKKEIAKILNESISKIKSLK